MKLIEVADGVHVMPCHVALVKHAGEGQSVLWTVGQGYLDGFTIDRDCDELVDEINQALEDEDEEGTQEDEEL